MLVGHLMTENRHGLVVDADMTEATGTAEPEAALTMMARLPGADRKTLGADKNYDQRHLVEGTRAHNVTPQVTRKVQYTTLDERTTRLAGYAQSQK